GNVAGRILVFPKGKGSTVGSFTMYDLKVHGKQPAAIINASAETIVATGAVISSIPMIDLIDTDLLRTGDDVTVDGTNGIAEINNVRMISSVSSVILSGDKILMLRRPDTASSFPGVWSLVAGKIEESEGVNEAAVREIYEETKIRVSSPAASLDPMYVRDRNIIWKVHPMLFLHDGKEVRLNDENMEYKWIMPEETERTDTVPGTVTAVRQLISKIR
ncbi:MAG: DUF126 domain-containing protein, partial [Methanomassiliicoccaceae archaeon]|nr:DUF126 domain-containing protein [Methanomassiliicoccaceae archaeon]